LLEAESAQKGLKIVPIFRPYAIIREYPGNTFLAAKRLESEWVKECFHYEEAAAVQSIRSE